MKLDVVLGLQWGDEGKGKIVDVLASRYPAVARFQGGPNAGHSLHFDGHNFVVRSIPSGIFRDGSTNIIGSGVVLDPITFLKSCRNWPWGVWQLYLRRHLQTHWTEPEEHEL